MGFQRGRAVWLAAAMMLGIGAGPGLSMAAPPMVLATTGMIGDTVASLGGECIDVEVLMGPGVDPHLFQASASDVLAFQQAALIVFNGYGLEGQLDNVLTRVGERRPTLALAEAASAEGPREPMRGTGGYSVDPHLWMDAALWAQGVTPLAGMLTDIAPGCAAAINDRADTLNRRLRALDQWIQARIASIPEPQRVLLTAHDAFRYYARAYDIDVRGIQGISTSAEASVADIQDTAALIAERGIPAIFVETTINPRTVQAVVEAARERSAEVSIGGSIHGDALGEPGTLADSLIGMLIHNTAEITRALGGTMAPLPAVLAPWQESLDARRVSGG